MLRLKRYKPTKGPRKGAETFDQLLRRTARLADERAPADETEASTETEGGEE